LKPEKVGERREGTTNLSLACDAAVHRRRGVHCDFVGAPAEGPGSAVEDAVVEHASALGVVFELVDCDAVY